MLIDTHIHLDFPVFDEDRASLMASAQQRGIQRFILPATTRQSWPNIAKLSQKFPAISPAYGIHPYFVQTHSLNDCTVLDEWLENHACVAVGETGLDFFLKDLDPTQQISLFEAQLDIAKNHAKPVILHARKAVEKVTILLKKHQIQSGIIHSYNGSLVQAMQLIDLGFKLGFGGAITYPRAIKLRALVKQLPLEAICLETDAPDQPSKHFHGKRNEPIALIEVLNTIAELHNKTPGTVSKQTTENAHTVFNLKTI